MGMEIILWNVVVDVVIEVGLVFVPCKWITGTLEHGP